MGISHLKTWFIHRASSIPDYQGELNIGYDNNWKYISAVMIDYMISNASTAAFWSGILAIISMVALFIMFGGGAIFGPINDATSAIQFLLLIPVALAWNRMTGSNFPILSTLVMLLGILAMLAFASAQILLVMRFVKFEQTLNLVLALGTIVAIWLILNSFMSFSLKAFPMKVAWAGIITGFSMIMVAIGYWWLGGPKHPITGVFFLIGAIGMPLWAFWTAKLL